MKTKDFEEEIRITEDGIFEHAYTQYKKPALALFLALIGFTLWLWVGILAKTSAEGAVYFLDIGQGDAQMLVLPSPSEKGGAVKILIDGGRGRQIISALDDVLGARNDKYLDILLVTHPHDDHYGGFVEVLKNYEVGVFIYNGQDVEEGAWRTLKDEVAKRGVPSLVLRTGDAIRYGDTELAILSPDETLVRAGDLNEASLVVLAKIGSGEKEIRALMTGDIGFPTEDALLASGQDLAADILKVGHHGSKYSTGANFVHAVRPVISVIGVGENRHGHPAARVLETLEAGGSLVLTTKEHGTIKVPLDRNARGSASAESAGGLLASAWNVISGTYRAPRLTVVTLSDALAENKPFSLVAYEECRFNAPKEKADYPVRLNEIAWMGAESGTTHEWIELSNTSSEALNITGWQLVNENERIHATFPQGSFFDGDFLILARAAANESLGLRADLVFTGSIRNSREGLRLFDNKCNLVDEVFASPNWPAGDNRTKQTMERVGAGVWATSKAPGGSPRLPNTGVAKETKTSSGRGAAPKESTQSKPAKPSQPAVATSCVNLNTATAGELTAITGIGPVYAARIVEGRAERPFDSIEDLTRVSGIGPATVAKIQAQGLACVGN